MGLKRVRAHSIAREISSKNGKDAQNNFLDARELKNLPSVGAKTYDEIWTEFNVDRPGLYAFSSPTPRQKSKQILVWLNEVLNPNGDTNLLDNGIIRDADEALQRRTRDNIIYSVKAFNKQPNGALLREHGLVHLFRKDTLRTIAIF